MPSHLAHQIFIEDALRRTGIDRKVAIDGRLLTLGAQGPDIFYHNQMSTPSAFAYGSIVHRGGYGGMSAAMFSHAAANSRDGALSYLLGYASHAILDRHTHSFINYWSGWYDKNNPDTARLRGMHPFLERLIDVEILRRYRNRTPVEYGFFSRVDCGDDLPDEIEEMLRTGLRSVYPRAARDQRLRERLRNAYHDTRWYYRATDRVDQEYMREARQRELLDQGLPRWLSIVHPPSIPRDLDVLNLTHRRWCEPCSRRESHTEDFLQLFEQGLMEMVGVVRTIHAAWREVADGNHAVEEGSTTLMEATARVETVIGNSDLSDRRETARPCRKRYSDPLPLAALQEEIKAAIDAGRAG